MYKYSQNILDKDIFFVDTAPKNQEINENVVLVYLYFSSIIFIATKVNLISEQTGI